MIFFSTNELIGRLKKGDEEAFKVIYERYWSKLYELCFYYTRSREDTEDTLMRIFMSLWNNRDKVNIENLEPYLVKAAKNQSFKYIQKQQQQRERIHLLKKQAAFFTDDSDSPDRVMEIKELDLQIQDHVESLPEKTKRIFVLNREKGLTYQEIACSLSISVKTVEYHISKALHVLGKYILALLVLLFPFFF
jgi:RNA polymerase sigma-70 factor (ECF subfamily)